MHDVPKLPHACCMLTYEGHVYSRSGQLAEVLTDRHIENCQDLYLVIIAVALSLCFVDYHESNSAA